VKRVRRTLTRLRGAKDTRGLMDALAVCVRSNFAGTESVKMYSEVSPVSLVRGGMYADMAGRVDLSRYEEGCRSASERGCYMSRVREDVNRCDTRGETSVLSGDQQELRI
jgi:hypothetical protein